MTQMTQGKIGTKLAKTDDMRNDQKPQNQLPSWTNYLPPQVSDDVKQAIEETIFRNDATFRTASEENRRFIVQKLAKIFSFSTANYKITPERVYLLSLRGQVVVSLHYLVYLKLAAEAGVKVIRFERTERGEKVILRHADDGIDREYFLDYEAYQKRTGVWQTHFDVMFRKTLLKQAIMFLFADVYENELFAQVVNFEEEDLVEPAKEGDGAVSATPGAQDSRSVAKEAQDFRRKNTRLYARINQHIATFAKDKELYGEVEAFLALNGYKSVYDVTREADLKDLHALTEALAEHKTKGVDYGETMKLREQVLLTLQTFPDKGAIKNRIHETLSAHGYEAISEVGRADVLNQLLETTK